MTIRTIFKNLPSDPRKILSPPTCQVRPSPKEQALLRVSIISLLIFLSPAISESSGCNSLGLLLSSVRAQLGTLSRPELSADRRGQWQMQGWGHTLPGPGCPLGGGRLRREAETLTSLDPKPNSHSSCIALFYDPFIEGTTFIKRGELFSKNSFTLCPLLWFPFASDGHS